MVPLLPIFIGKVYEGHICILTIDWSQLGGALFQLLDTHRHIQTLIPVPVLTPLHQMPSQFLKVLGSPRVGYQIRRWSILAVALGSFSVTAAKADGFFPNSPLGGRIFNGRQETSVSDTTAPGGGILKSGRKTQRKENASSALLAQKLVLIQIKMVNGQLAVQVHPVTE